MECSYVVDAMLFCLSDFPMLWSMRLICVSPLEGISSLVVEQWGLMYSVYVSDGEMQYKGIVLSVNT